MLENIQHILNRGYRSAVVDRISANGNAFEAKGLSLTLPHEF